MTIKQLYGWLATPWYHIRPLSPRHQSREAFLEHRRKNPDGARK